MHSLFALISILYVCRAQAAPGSVFFSVGHQDQIQLNEIDTKKDSQSVAVGTPTFFQSLTLKIKNEFEQTDISTRNLTTATGQQMRLSEVDDGKRQILSASIEYTKGPFLGSVSTSQDVQASVFSRRSYSMLLQISPYSGASRFFVSGEISQQAQPQSFFTDPQTLQSRQRLSQIGSQVLTVGWEQILTETFRSQLSYTDSRIFNYRPRQQKIHSANSYAVGTRSTLRLDLGASFENRAESLQDDRGYFEARWMEGQYIYETSLDTLVGLGWSTVFESENDPRRLVTTQVGTDAIGIFLDKKLNSFSSVLKISTTKTSQNDTGISGSGEFKWEF